jgi:hypothetical protein
MRFFLEIGVDNAAFADTLTPEITRILRECADQVERGATSQRLVDINGNTVGYCGIDRVRR